MAKRYHDGHPVKHHSAHKAIDGGHYAGIDERRKLEHLDGMMISEDHSAMANMPQEWTIKPWPDHNAYLPEDIDDTIRGVNAQIDLDDRQRAKTFNPKKV